MARTALPSTAITFPLECIGIGVAADCAVWELVVGEESGQLATEGCSSAETRASSSAMRRVSCSTKEVTSSTICGITASALFRRGGSVGSMRSAGSGDMGVHQLRPGRQQLHQHPQNRKRKNHESDSR